MTLQKIHCCSGCNLAYFPNAMQLRVDVNADGNVLATVVDNELQVNLVSKPRCIGGSAHLLAKNASEYHA